MSKTGFKIIFVIDSCRKSEALGKKFLMFVESMIQILKEMMFSEVEVVTSAFQPPGLECRSFTEVNFSD